MERITAREAHEALEEDAAEGNDAVAMAYLLGSQQVRSQFTTYLGSRKVTKERAICNYGSPGVNALEGSDGQLRQRCLFFTHVNGKLLVLMMAKHIKASCVRQSRCKQTSKGSGKTD